MLKSVTVLFSACGSPGSPASFWWVKNNGERNIRIVGIDMSDDPSIQYYVDSYYRVPSAKDESYIDIVLNICKKENIDIYFPSISLEVAKVSERLSEFIDIGVKVSAMDKRIIDIANNKLKVYQFMKNNGIPTPNFYPVYSVQDFIDGCKKLGYPDNPVCIKLTQESGSRGVRIIDSKKNRYNIFAHEKPNSFYTSFNDMLNILNDAEKLDEMMLVEYLPGNEYTVDLLADNGTVVYQVGRENIVSLMSIAQESILREDKKAYLISSQIVELLKMDGNVGFDFMRNRAGTAVLTDINPRTTATLSVIAAGGVNLRYLRIKQLLGEELPKVSVQYGTRLSRRYGEIYCRQHRNFRHFQHSNFPD